MIIPNDLENDKNLNFNLNGIKMAQTSATGDTTKAYFFSDFLKEAYKNYPSNL